MLSALIGLERESIGKAAGLRTHLLVGMGAALATQLSQQVAGYGNLDAADPGRIAAQVVSGIGFIGAGVILQSRGYSEHSLEGAFVKEHGAGCRIKLRARKAEVPRIVFELGRSPEIREVRTV